MPTSITRLAEDDQHHLETAVEAFADAWNESSTPPIIREYLSSCPAAVWPALIVELIKIDLEQRWQIGLRRLIEDYVAEIPEVAPYVDAPLILEEFHARKLAGDDVNASEFMSRFPDHVAMLEQLIAVDPLLHSSLMNSLVRAPVGLKTGDSIDDFDLLVMLGQGAFATVFLARQRSMQRLVAVKISADQGDEPQTLAQLEHDNIVRVYDQRSIADRGLRLMYMQYAAGGTLAAVIQYLSAIGRDHWSGHHYLRAIEQGLDARGESISKGTALHQKLTEMSWPQVVCWIGVQLSRALDHAHRQGVLHRDLKPANVLLTSEGVPKLADFNISFSKNVTGATAVAYFGGSLAYMSPEQLEACNPQHDREADSLDERSDLYSLGVLTWELLTGERPFVDDEAPRGDSRLNEMTARRRAGPPEISIQDRREGRGVHEVLQRCLASDREDRFGTALELAHELELCLQPDARQLLSVPTAGWRYWTRRYPLIAVTVITVIPNAVAAIFNFLYNHREIIERLPSAEPTFMRIQSIINLIAFPTGILSAGWLAGSVTKATRIDRSERLSALSLAEQRRRCLNLGNVAAMVGLTLWLIAAPAYPISLHLMLGSVPVEVYIHFVASLAICGLIAAAYPFFGVSLVAVRCFYPSLLDRESMNSVDRQHLLQLARQTWLYLVLAASVPMVAIIVLTIGEPDRHSALIVLAGGGLIGYALAVSAFRIIQADITTLIRAIWRNDHL